MKGITGSQVPFRVETVFRQATRLVGWLPEDLRCHEVACALGKILDLPVQHGHYLSIQHSWLWASSDCRWLLDVYSVANFPPVRLVDTALVGTVDGSPTPLMTRAIYTCGVPDIVPPIDLGEVARLVIRLTEDQATTSGW